jgi:hypothetical protein
VDDQDRQNGVGLLTGSAARKLDRRHRYLNTSIGRLLTQPTLRLRSGQIVEMIVNENPLRRKGLSCKVDPAPSYCVHPTTRGQFIVWSLSLPWG